MLLENVIRHTIYLLAEAERDAALQQRLRGTAGDAKRAANAAASHHARLDRSHDRIRIVGASNAAEAQPCPPESPADGPDHVR